MSRAGEKNVVGIKQEDDTSFAVKIQGAGVEPFELQVKEQKFRKQSITF